MSYCCGECNKLNETITRPLCYFHLAFVRVLMAPSLNTFNKLRTIRMKKVTMACGVINLAEVMCKMTLVSRAKSATQINVLCLKISLCQHYVIYLVISNLPAKICAMGANLHMKYTTKYPDCSRHKIRWNEV